MQWVELLPDAQTPSWLGLPNNAERVLLTTQGECPALAAPLPAPGAAGSRGGSRGCVSCDTRAVLGKSLAVYVNEVWKSPSGFSSNGDGLLFIRIVKRLVLSGTLQPLPYQILSF